MPDNPGLKTTSLTLLTVLLVGITAITVIISTPATASAASDTNLFVSAQRTGNHVAGLQIVEVVVTNDSLVPFPITPHVTVNGNLLVMTETITGNHYAYFASYSDVKEILDANTHNPKSNPGLDFGRSCNHHHHLNDQATDTICDVTGVIKSSKSATLPGSVWPFIQLYDFPDGLIEIQYGKIDGSNDTASLVFGTNNDTIGVTLDRDTYPAASEIHAAITDHRLNIDPTSPDTWTWDVTGQSMYYGLDDIQTNQLGLFPDDDISAYAVDSALVCDGCSIQIDSNEQETATSIVEIAPVENRPTNSVNQESAYQAETWLSVSESGGYNTGIFTTTDRHNDSALQTTHDIHSGASATMTYDTVHIVDIIIRHAVPTVIVDPPADQWTIGMPIHITVIDDSANKNSKIDERLSIADADSVIPTVTTGNPFTLSHSNNTTWVGYPVPLPNDEAARLQDTKTDTTTHDPAKLNLFGNPSDPFSYRSTPTTAFLGFPNFATVEPSTDRLFLVFNDEHDPIVQTSLDALGLSPNSPFLTGFPILVLDQDYSDLRDFLVDTGIDGQPGINLFRYDFSSLGGDDDDVSVNKFQINVDRKPIASFPLSGSSGVVPIPDDFVSDVYNSEITGRLQIILRVSGMDINAHTPYPVVADILSFGLKGNGSNDNGNSMIYTEIVANQIARLELEESTDNQGTFEGVVNHVTVSPFEIRDADILTILSDATLGGNASIIMVTDPYGDDTLMSENSLQLGVDLSNTLAVTDDPASLSTAITTTNLRVTDSSYNVIDDVIYSDAHIHIAADLSNTHTTDKSFVYQIQIQDGDDGATIAIPRILGFLSGNQSVSPLISWTPPGPGMYTLTTFVWESFESPSILSNSISIDVEIN